MDIDNIIENQHEELIKSGVDELNKIIDEFILRTMYCLFVLELFDSFKRNNQEDSNEKIL